MARRIKSGVTKADFLKTIAAEATELRRRIEAEVTGLEDSPQAIAARRAKALAPDGYEFFCRTYFPHYLKSPSASELHKYLFKRLPQLLQANTGQSEAIAAPRGEAKSTFVSQLFTLWNVIRRHIPYIIIVMDAFDQAAIMLAAIKSELEVNPRLLLDFPEACGQGRVWKEGVILTKGGIKIEGVGAGKRIRGRRHGPHRVGLVVIDDMENDENVERVEQRDKGENYIDSAVMNLGDASGALHVVMIGTILHYDSVLARKMNDPMWNSKKFSSIIRWPDHMDLWQRWEELLRNDGQEAAERFYAGHLAEMNAGAVVSWPEIRPLLSLMKLRVKIKPPAFDKEQQNDPVSQSDAMFGNPTFWVEVLHEWIKFGACDPSLGKQNKSRDPSAILVGGLNRSTGVLDVIEALVRRRLPDRIIADIIEMQKIHNCVRWGIETVQFQEFLRTELVKRSAIAGVPVPAIAIQSISDKDLRIERMQPHVNNGLIRFHASQTVLLGQMRRWPMDDHDDGPDALEMLHQVAFMTGPSAGVTVPAKSPIITGSASRGGMFARRSVTMNRRH